jgi:hypothetical protein
VVGICFEDAELISVRSAARLAMDPFEKNQLLPVEVLITVAINIVAVALGYYVVMFWGIIDG